MSNLTAGDVAEAQREFRGLMDDVQALQDTPEIVIKRGDVIVLAVRPKSIRLDNQQADRGETNGPTSTGAQSGKVKVATEEYTAEVRTGDRFVWQGQPCQVTTPAMARALTGMTTFSFVTNARNRG